MMEIKKLLNKNDDKIKLFMDRLATTTNVTEYNEAYKGMPVSEDIVKIGLHFLLERQINKKIKDIMAHASKTGEVKCRITIETE